ncbi:MAG: hypothetical protein U0174_04440 [Polyangiaceae bacterium]
MQTTPSTTATAPQAAPAPASASPSADVAESRATTFQAVEGGETRSGEVLLVEAYAVLWVILFAWLALMWRKQARLNARIEELDRALDRAVAAQAHAQGGVASAEGKGK